MKTIIFSLLIFSQVSFGQYEWSRINQPASGKIKKVEFARDSIYAVGNGGVFVSSKENISWRYIGLGSDRFISDILVLDNYIFVTSEKGIYRSNNKIINWVKVCEGTFNSITVIDTILIAGSESDGIFSSINNGISWNATNNGIDNFRITLVYEAEGVLLAMTYGSLFRSIDSAKSWIKVDSLPIGFWSPGITNNNGTLYSIKFSNYARIYKSTDLGLSWFLPPGSTNPSDLLYGIYSKGNEIYVGGYYYGVFKTTDEGVTWTEINNGITNKDIFSINGTDSVLVSSSMDGVCFSYNKGVDWYNLSQGLNNSEVTRLVSVDNNLFAGTYGAGISRSNDNGLSWIKLNLPYLYVGDLLYAHNRLYTLLLHSFGALTSNIYCSTDLGENWTLTSLNTEFTCLAACGNNLFAGSFSGIFKSTDFGATFTKITNGIPHNTSAISIASNDSVVLFISHNYWVYRSTDSGLTWSIRMLEGLSNTCCIKSVGDRFYIGSSQTNKLFETTDNGLHWSSVQIPYVFGLVTTFYGDDNYKFVGLSENQGVFISDNYGRDWQISNPFTANRVLAFEKHNLTLYTGTDGAGIYKLNNVVLMTDSIENNILNNSVLKFNLSQNFPNPFNPSTMIKYSVPKESNVKIKVYDILGRMVQELVNENKPGGYHEVEFNGSILASGVYFYQIQSGDFVDTKKMILLK